MDAPGRGRHPRPEKSFTGSEAVKGGARFLRVVGKLIVIEAGRVGDRLRGEEAPETTRMTVPAGIFRNTESAMRRSLTHSIWPVRVTGRSPVVTSPQRRGVTS
jgi:hypothetical protein